MCVCELVRTILYLFLVSVSFGSVNPIIGNDVLVRIVHVSSLAAMVSIGHCRILSVNLNVS